MNCLFAWCGRSGRGSIHRMLRVLPVACALLAGVAASDLEVRVRPNGKPQREGATPYVVDSLSSLREKVGHAFKLLTLGTGWWLADLEGFNVSSWEQVEALPQEERLFSVVPEGKLFQWSPRRVGERFPVKTDGWEGIEMETIASSPKVFLIHNLFSEEETLYLINRAVARTGENALTASGVGFSTHGARSTGGTRTSSNAFDADSQTSKRLIKRCFDILRIPFSMSMADGLQILHYQEGQAYIAHTDWFATGAKEGYNFDPTEPDGSNRFATVFLYLWPPPSGGYTVFPKASLEEGLNDSAFVSTGQDSAERTRAMLQASRFYEEGAWELDLTRDCFSKLSVKPMRLGATLFYHQEPMTGRLLSEAQHGACPSLTGTKWGANLWIWNRPRHLSKPDDSSGEAPKNNIKATFQNREQTTIKLQYSMDDGDSWTDLKELAPKTQFNVDTYPGHYWRFVDAANQEVSRWVAPEGIRAAFVGSDGSAKDYEHTEF